MNSRALLTLTVQSVRRETETQSGLAIPPQTDHRQTADRPTHRRDSRPQHLFEPIKDNQSMNRRTFLATVTTGTSGLIAGCSQAPLIGNETDATQPSPTESEGPFNVSKYGTPVPKYVDPVQPHATALRDLRELYTAYLNTDTETMKQYLHTPRRVFVGEWEANLPSVSVDGTIEELNARFYTDYTVTESELVEIASKTDRLTAPDARVLSQTPTHRYTVNPKANSSLRPDNNVEARFFNTVLRKKEWILSLEENVWKAL